MQGRFPLQFDVLSIIIGNNCNTQKENGMGLFDRLLNNATKTVGNMVKDAVGDAVSSALNQNGNATSGSANAGKPVQTATAAVDSRSFQAKFQEIIQKAGSFELQKNVPAEELEQQYGKIWTRGASYAKPDAISYVVCKNGAPVLYIRHWLDYGSYDHTANREIKRFCDSYGIKMLDFFDYLPNRMDYMTERINACLPTA